MREQPNFAQQLADLRRFNLLTGWRHPGYQIDPPLARPYLIRLSNSSATPKPIGVSR